MEDLAVEMSLQTILVETDETQIIQVIGIAEEEPQITIHLIQNDQAIAIPIADLVLEIILELEAVGAIIVHHRLLADHTLQAQATEVAHQGLEVALQV